MKSQEPPTVGAVTTRAVQYRRTFRTHPSPEGRGCREAAGEGYQTKLFFMRYPSPGASHHPLPSGEGCARKIFLSWTVLVYDLACNKPIAITVRTSLRSARMFR